MSAVTITVALSAGFYVEANNTVRADCGAGVKVFAALPDLTAVLTNRIITARPPQLTIYQHNHVPTGRWKVKGVDCEQTN